MGSRPTLQSGPGRCQPSPGPHVSRQGQQRPLAPPVPSVVWVESLVTGAQVAPAPTEVPLVTWLLVPK